MFDEKKNDDLTIRLSRMFFEDNLINFDEKKFFLKLRKNYLWISGINNRKEIQERLYTGLSKNEIIKFELNRILLNGRSLKEYSEQIFIIEKLLELYDDSMTDDLYKKVINLIIKIEVESDMRIALFSEFCEMYKEYQDKFFDKRKDTISRIR